ncbi:MAG: hypothetical protein HY791_14915 [Deltaproteobacteria bacterium]|nr:hypothetical protein [Deltaproteobacteria bacterium]
MRVTAFKTLVSSVVLFAPLTATAEHEGFYTTIGVGFGQLSGDDLIVNELPGPGDLPKVGEGCCASGGLALSFRMGWTFLHTIGPEFAFLAHGWDLASDEGGAGFIGGGIRFLGTGLLRELEVIEPEFPVGFGLGANFGYTIVGKDFAYTGTYLDLDATIDWHATKFLSVGARFDYAIPFYSPFVFTSYSDDRGRCLDGSGKQAAEPAHAKGTPECTGSGPSAGYLSPSLVLTFHTSFF